MKILNSSIVGSPSLWNFQKRNFINAKKIFLSNTPHFYPVKKFSFRKYSTNQFFNITNRYSNYLTNSSVPYFLKNKNILTTAIEEISPQAKENYLYSSLAEWISAYAATNPPLLHKYFSENGTITLNEICSDFIKFCFHQKIYLDKEKMLTSFSYHNKCSDDAVKGELLSKLTFKENINLLGFGLGDGEYEKEIAQYILQQQLARSVNLFGFEPNPQATEGIQFLTDKELSNPKLHFDIIIARWVLHHVELKYRWNDFIRCINRTSPEAIVLVVEHGFLSQNVSAFDRKLYYFLNATLDVIANIGLRPWWFTSTTPDIGANFYIHYLQPEDLEAIKAEVSMPLNQKVYDVGPTFPNQTIYSMKLS